jgi:SAM-dependent methyltransferase
MDAHYQAHYRDLFQRHWWWRARSELILKKIAEVTRGASNATILDVGCGEGLFFGELSRFGDVEGIELEQALPSDPDLRRRIHTCAFDEKFMPGKQYSLILMLDVLEHLANSADALANVRRLLAPGGIFLATVPALPLLWTNHDVLNQHKTRYTAKTLREQVEGAGLRVSVERYFFFWTVPAKLLVRGVETVFGSQPKVPQVPPGWINQSLYFLSRLEQETLGQLRLPLGSSIVLIATA